LDAPVFAVSYTAVNDRPAGRELGYMTIANSKLEAVSKVDGQETSAFAAGGYDVPQLTPIGNLKDLLAATNGSQCDMSGAQTTGSDPMSCE
jgi:hypothetical protein